MNKIHSIHRRRFLTLQFRMWQNQNRPARTKSLLRDETDLRLNESATELLYETQRKTDNRLIISLPGVPE